MLLRLTCMQSRRSRWPVKGLLIAALCFASLSVSLPKAVGQVAPSPDAPPQGPAGDPNQDDQQQPMETLKVNVNLVSLYFTVHDKRGALILTSPKTTSPSLRIRNRRRSRTSPRRTTSRLRWAFCSIPVAASRMFFPWNRRQAPRSLAACSVRKMKLFSSPLM